VSGVGTVGHDNRPVEGCEAWRNRIPDGEPPLRSRRAPSRRMVASSSHLEISWMLMGGRSELMAYGTESAGRPVRLNGQVGLMTWVQGR
jgi:hypothetical protein